MTEYRYGTVWDVLNTLGEPQVRVMVVAPTGDRLTHGTYDTDLRCLVLVPLQLDAWRAGEMRFLSTNQKIGPWVRVDD